MENESTNTWYFGPNLLNLIDMFAMWLNYTFGIILSLKIKYDDSRNQNNFVIRTISIVHDVNQNYTLQFSIPPLGACNKLISPEK